MMLLFWHYYDWTIESVVGAILALIMLATFLVFLFFTEGYDLYCGPAILSGSGGSDYGYFFLIMLVYLVGLATMIHDRVGFNWIEYIKIGFILSTIILILLMTDTLIHSGVLQTFFYAIAFIQFVLFFNKYYNKLTGTGYSMMVAIPRPFRAIIGQPKRS